MARDDELRFYSVRELRELPTEPNNYLIDGLLWEHDHVILLGKDKSGKSILALQMACALSCGDSFLGEYEIPEPMQVIYIQTEGKRHETIERLSNMTSMPGGLGCNEDNLYILTTHSWQMDTNEGYDVMERIILKQKLTPRVIILDPLYMSMEGDLSDNQASRKMVRNIRKLGAAFDAAIILLHHAHRDRMGNDGKKMEEGDSSIMGSFVWKAFPDHVIMLRKRPDKVRTLSCDTQRSSRVIENMQLILRDPKPLMFEVLGSSDHMPYVDTVKSYLKEINRPSYAQEISSNTGLSLSAVRKSLSYLSKPNVNEASKVNPGKRPTLYTFNYNGGCNSVHPPI